MIRTCAGWHVQPNTVTKKSARAELITNIIVAGLGRFSLKKNCSQIIKYLAHLHVTLSFKTLTNLTDASALWMKSANWELLVCGLRWPCYHSLLGSSHCHRNFQMNDSFLWIQNSLKLLHNCVQANWKEQGLMRPSLWFSLLVQLTLLCTETGSRQANMS